MLSFGQQNADLKITYWGLSSYYNPLYVKEISFRRLWMKDEENKWIDWGFQLVIEQSTLVSYEWVTENGTAKWP